MRPIRILEAIRQGSIGGGETHVYDLSTRLNKSAFKPIVLSFTDGPMVRNLRDKGIETHVIHSRFPFDPRVISKVTSLIGEQKVDIIHAHGTRAASNLWLPAGRNKRPLLYTIHGWSFNDNQSTLMRLARIKVEQFLTRKAQVSICVSESNRQTGIRAIPGFEGTVINNGISFKKFSPDVSGDQVARELNKQPGEVWIGMIARLTRQKDPLTLIKAFHIASRHNPSLRLAIVGDGDMKEEVAKAIDTFGLQETAKLLPFREDVPQLLKVMDIYCLPSLWEGLPIGLLEAMAMQKAVIATQVDGNQEIVNHETGILIQKQRPDELSGAILKLAGDADYRLKMGLKARSLVESSFSLEQMVAKTEECYEHVLRYKR